MLSDDVVKHRQMHVKEALRLYRGQEADINQGSHQTIWKIDFASTVELMLQRLTQIYTIC